MKHLIIIGFACIGLIYYAPRMYGQDVQDRIILNSGDTIACEITLVNDQNIFYNYYKRKIQKSDFVSLIDVDSYDWISMNQTKSAEKHHSRIPYAPRGRWRIGIKLTTHCNYPIWHLTPSISINKGNHNLFFGAEYTWILDEEILGDPADYYPKNEYWGFAIGYRYIINSKWKRANIFLETNFSVYKIKYTTHSLGSGFWEEEKYVVENTAGVGVNYKITKNIEIYGSVGVGSTNGFFLIIDYFIPHSCIGIEYKFR